MPTRAARRRSAPDLYPLEDRRLMSAVVGPTINPSVTLTPAATADAVGATVVGYTPAQMRTAYGLSALTFNGGKTAATGAGQTIAIVDAYNDPNIKSDLSTFDAKLGVAAASLSVVSQTGSTTGLPATDAGWAQEISLDVEWAHAIAPAAKILLVETKSSGMADLLAGVNYARTLPAVTAISMSWGTNEFNGETAYDGTFTTPSNHAGITFVASAGDSGSAAGPEWPAANTGVLSVGGTALSLSSSGTYTSETGWADGGGGTSRYEAEPSFQYTAQSTGYRTTPDVAYDADPDTGVAVYDSLASQGYSGWMEFGGTSAGAPQWAAIAAIADQGRATINRTPLSGPCNTLPTLYGLYATGSYSTDFHDVTSGSTSASVRAGTGYDEVSGLGTPKVAALVASLMNSTLWVKQTQAPTATLTTGKLVAAIRSDVAVDTAVLVTTAAPASSTPALFGTGGLNAPAPVSFAVVAAPVAAAPATLYSVPPVDASAGTDASAAAIAAVSFDATTVTPDRALATLAPADSADSPLSTFTLSLLTGLAPAPAIAADARSFAATLAASSRAAHPLAVVAAAGAATALWLSTGSDRDRRQPATSPDLVTD